MDAENGSDIGKGSIQADMTVIPMFSVSNPDELIGHCIVKML
jgi:hypothetical protein